MAGSFEKIAIEKISVSVRVEDLLKLLILRKRNQRHFSNKLDAHQHGTCTYFALR